MVETSITPLSVLDLVDTMWMIPFFFCAWWTRYLPLCRHNYKILHSLFMCFLMSATLNMFTMYYYLENKKDCELVFECIVNGYTLFVMNTILYFHSSVPVGASVLK
jgi:hypothetical protein